MLHKTQLCFNITCYLVTLSLLVVCVYLYCKNDDLCEVSFKKFDEDTFTLYPSTTICFPNPFNEELLAAYGYGINSTSYKAFLLGYHWDDRMLNISYDQVTWNLKKYIMNPTAYYNLDPDEYHFKTLKHFKEITFPIYQVMAKCITFDMPTKAEEKLL